MSSIFASSGDVLIDRRFSYAQALLEEQDWDAAAEMLHEISTLAPAWPAVWFALGQAENNRANCSAARVAFRQVIALDPMDSLGAGAELARLGDRNAELSPAFVRTLFDQYADRFETHLVDALAYRGPELLVSLLNKFEGKDRRFLRGLDLGCGTGLMGKALAGRIDHLTGIDLAPRMVAKATESGGYHTAETAEAITYLGNQDADSFDLIIAADVLPYIGDLTDFMRETARTLAPGGLLLATAQTCDGNGFKMGEDLRFHHSAPYLASMLKAAEFRQSTIEPCVKRLDRGAPVASLALLAERPST
jgi:predicted TPR repeat methyltransferase